MKNTSFDPKRRCFFKMAGSAAILAALPLKKSLEAVEPAKPLNLEDPTVKALGYVQDRSKADLKKFPHLKPADVKNQSCTNCQQFTLKNKPWGSCIILPMGLVNENGWCSAWLKKA